MRIVASLMEIVDSKEYSQNIHDILEVQLCNLYLRGEKYELTDEELNLHGIQKAHSPSYDSFVTKTEQEIQAEIDKLEESVQSIDPTAIKTIPPTEVKKHIQTMFDIEFLKSILSMVKAGQFQLRVPTIECEGIEMKQEDFNIY